MKNLHAETGVPTVNSERANRSTVAIDHAAVVLLLILSGNQVVTMQGRSEIAIVLVSLLIASLFMVRGQPIISVRPLFVMLGFLIIFAAQGILFTFFPLITVTGFLLKVFIGYSVVRLVRNFPLVYVRVTAFLCLVSLCFFVPASIFSNWGIDIRRFFEPLQRLSGVQGDYHILIHNFDTITVGYMRNSSFFWEPSAFAIYLILSILFLGMVRDQLKKKTYIYLLFLISGTLFTTFSTAGFVLFPLAVSTHIRLRSVNRHEVVKDGLKVSVIVCVLLLFVAGFGQKKFLGEKIRQQYQHVQNRSPRWDKTRLGTFVFDLEYIRKEPFFGWGIHSQTRYSLHPYKAISGHGSDFSGLLARFGVFGFLLYLTTVYWGVFALKDGKLFSSAIITLVIMASLFSQAFLNFPMYLSLMFLGMDKWAVVSRAPGIAGFRLQIISAGFP